MLRGTVAKVKRADGAIVESRPDCGMRGRIGNDRFSVVCQRFSLYAKLFPPSSALYRSVSPSLSALSRRIHSCTSLTLVPSSISSQFWLHPFRRFCPPPRETINFPALNPGRGTRASPRPRPPNDSTIHHERTYSLYRLRVSCLPAWRHIYEAYTYSRPDPISIFASPPLRAIFILQNSKPSRFAFDSSILFFFRRVSVSSFEFWFLAEV